MTIPWTRSAGDTCNRRYASMKCPRVITCVEHNSARDLAGKWRGRDGVLELPGGRLAAVIQGNVTCTRNAILEWTISRESLAQLLNAGVHDPDDQVFPEYASAPTFVREDLLCVAIQGGLAAITTAGEVLASTRVDLVDDHGESPNYDRGGLWVTTIGGDLLRWDPASPSVERVREGLGYDLVCPAVLPDGELLLSCYDTEHGLCLLSPKGDLLWSSSLEDADLVPTYSHGGLCIAGSANQGRSIALSKNGELQWRLEQAARFASHPNGTLVAASSDRLTALDSLGATLWTYPLPNDEVCPIGHFVCEDLVVVCCTRQSCFAVAPPGELLWELHFGQVTSAPMPLSSGAIAFVADRQLVVACPANAAK